MVEIMKKVLGIVLALAMVLSLVGCFGPKSAQDYIDANPEEDIQEVIKQARDEMGMELAITSDEDTLIYTYRFLEEVDAEATSDHLDTQYEVLKKAAEEDVISEMKEFGVENPVVRYTYKNKDGSEIWSKDFK
jgi:hypothetical protein